jgi:transposase-like protein
MAPRNRNSFEISGGSHSTYTRASFRQDFPDDAACLEWLKNRRWPGGIECVKCGKVTPHYRVESRPSYSCQFCGHHVHPTAGTIFEKSSTNLVLWFEAIFIMASTRCGISAKQLEREIGVGYKTAWRMFKLIRQMLAEDTGPLDGTVEMDETYIVRSKRNRKGEKKKSGYSAGEQVIFGMVERGGRIVARHVGAMTSIELDRQMKAHVAPSARIMTDEAMAYRRLSEQGYRHDMIKHATKVYAKGDIHTQTIENFWMTLKGGVVGVYHGVGKDYLQSYIDEYAFRYNRRSKGYPMFRAFLETVCAPVSPSVPSAS